MVDRIMAAGFDEDDLTTLDGLLGRIREAVPGQ